MTTFAPGEPGPRTDADTEPDALRSKNRAAKLWRAAWRWHFYAGTFVMPVLLTLAVTGLGILMKPTLERTVYGDRLYVDIGASLVSYEAQRQAVMASYPTATVQAVTPPAHDGRSTQFDIVTAEDTSLSVYVNPYDGNVLGAIDNSTRLNSVLEKIHGTLWLGAWGDYFVEIVAGWTLVLMTTGLYLWWPRPMRWHKALSMRLGTPGRRRLRDLHATPGSAVAVIIIIIVVTGLPWSGFWGDRWAALSDDLDAGYKTPETPVSEKQAQALETAGLTVAWATDRDGVPLSPTFVHTSEEQVDDHYHADPGAPNDHQLTAQPLEEVVTLGRRIGMEPGFAIGLPEDETGVFALSNSWPSLAQDERTVFVDQYSPRVLTDHGWKSYGVMAKATSFGIDVHMGRQFGMLNAIVLAATCLIVIVAVITGPLMWWKRRDGSGTGLPKRENDPGLARGVIAIAAVLAVIYPLLGVSMVVVALLDRLVVRRVARLRQLFGMA